MRLDGGTHEELMDLERRYWDAVKEGDARTATTLSDDPCLLVGAQGVGEISREQMAGLFESVNYDLERFDLEDVHARQISDDVVILAYKVREKLVVEGEDVDLEAYDSSVWQRKNGDWVCVLHTESLAGDPFGRDRARA